MNNLNIAGLGNNSTVIYCSVGCDTPCVRTGLGVQGTRCLP
jgi:hypothetical protein